MVRQATTFRHVKRRQVNKVAKEVEARPDVFWGLNIKFKYFVCLKKKSVNSNVLSFNLKLFQTTVDIKSVIGGYSLRNYFVNVQYLKNTRII